MAGSLLGAGRDTAPVFSLQLHLEVGSLQRGGAGKEAMGPVLTPSIHGVCGSATNLSIQHSSSLGCFVRPFRDLKGGRKLRLRLGALGSQRCGKLAKLLRAPGRDVAAETTVPGLL